MTKIDLISLKLFPLILLYILLLRIKLSNSFVPIIAVLGVLIFIRLETDEKSKLYISVFINANPRPFPPNDPDANVTIFFSVSIVSSSK